MADIHSMLTDHDVVVGSIIDKCQAMYNTKTIGLAELRGMVAIAMTIVELHQDLSGVQKKSIVIKAIQRLNTHDEYDAMVPIIIDTIIFISKDKRAIQYINSATSCLCC